MQRSSRREFILNIGPVAVVGGSAALAAAQAQPARSTPGPPRRRIIPGSPSSAFSRAVRFDRVVFVAGVLGQKPGTHELVSGEFEPPCRQALENLKAAVEAAGSR